MRTIYIILLAPSYCYHIVTAMLNSKNKKPVTYDCPLLLRRIKAILIPRSISLFAELKVKAAFMTHVSVKLIQLINETNLIPNIKLLNSAYN
jgi:hypothetical protein